MAHLMAAALGTEFQARASGVQMGAANRTQKSIIDRVLREDAFPVRSDNPVWQIKISLRQAITGASAFEITVDSFADWKLRSAAEPIVGLAKYSWP